MSDWDSGFEEEQKETSSAPVKEVKPVKIGRKGIALMLTGLILVIIIVILTLHSCTVEKQLNNPSSGGSGKTAIVETNKPQSSGGSETTNFHENSSVNDVPGSSGPSETTSKNNGNSPSGNNSSSGELQQVAEPSLSKVVNASGMVKSKKIYHVGSSYMYCVNIAMISGDKTVDVYYYCGRKAYDTVYAGQAVIVSYQVDSEGNISVYAVKIN